MNVVRSLSWMIIASTLVFTGLAVAAGGPSVSAIAEYLEVSDGVTSRGKYYFGPAGIRIEGEVDGEQQLTIVNFSRGVVWNIEEAEQMYFEMALKIPKSGRLTGPCADAEMSGGLLSAEKIGSETADGRKLEKWECRVQEGVDTVWYDTALQTVVRSHDWDGTRFELRNIKKAELSPDLFQPPTGCARVVIPGGIN